MKTTTFAVLAVVGSAAAQGVTDKISPKGAAPAGCSTSYNGKFEVTIAKVSTTGKRDELVRRGSCTDPNNLIATLANGVMTDAKSRTGYIASNYQFQFDGPPQAGAIYTAGYTVCGNGSIALGSTTTFYECASGSFYNLYDRSWAPQCSPVQMVVLPCGAADAPGGAGQAGDGQVVGTTVVATTVVVPLSDGQPQVKTTMVPVPLCQITDGQLQAHTTPCASITSVAPKPTTTAVPVSQYSDGQIQVTPPGSAPPPAATPTTSATPKTSSAPPASGSPAPTTSSTLKTTAAPSTTPSSSASKTSASTSAPVTSSPTVSGAGSVQMGSIAALAIGILGAVWFL